MALHSSHQAQGACAAAASSRSLQCHHDQLVARPQHQLLLRPHHEMHVRVLPRERVRIAGRGVAHRCVAAPPDRLCHLLPQQRRVERQPVRARRLPQVPERARALSAARCRCWRTQGSRYCSAHRARLCGAAARKARACTMRKQLACERVATQRRWQPGVALTSRGRPAA